MYGCCRLLTATPSAVKKKRVKIRKQTKQQKKREKTRTSDSTHDLSCSSSGFFTLSLSLFLCYYLIVSHSTPFLIFLFYVLFVCVFEGLFVSILFAF